MIHYLGKVYLEYAEAKPLTNRLSARPSQYIRIVDKGLSSIMDIHTNDLNIMNFKNLEQVIEEFKGFNKFIDFCLKRAETDKLIIYCDEPTLKSLLVSLWVSIFPGITPEMITYFSTSFYDWELLKREDPNEYINISLNSSRILKNQFIGKYWCRDIDEAKGLLRTCQGLDLTDKKDLISLEYFLIENIVSEKENTNQYSKRFEDLYKRNLVTEILLMIQDIKEFIILLNFEGRKKETALLNGLSSIDELAQDSRYKILFDANIDCSTDTYDYIKKEYKILRVVDTLYTDALTIHGLISESFVSSEEFKTEFPITTYMVNRKQEPPLNEMVNEDILQIKNYHFLRGFINMGVFNQYLIQSILLTKKTNPAVLDELK